MVTVLLLAGDCLGAAFTPDRHRWGASRRPFSALACGSRLRGRLAAERIVGEKGEAAKDHQEQAEQHGQRLHRRKGQPEPAFFALRFLSERGAQFVGRLSHEPPEIGSRRR